MFYITFYITWDCGVKSKRFFTFYLSEGTFFISVLEEFNFLLPFFKTSPDCFGSVDEGRRFSRPDVFSPCPSISQCCPWSGERTWSSSRSVQPALPRACSAWPRGGPAWENTAGDKIQRQLRRPLSDQRRAGCVRTAKLTSSSCCSVSSRFFWVENDGFPE